MAGRVQSINESGTDSQGNPAAYITIQQAGAYRVKGTIGELQQGAISEGDRIKLTSRLDSSKTWLGTVTLVDYENPVKNENNNYISSSDSGESASKYPFYVELDSIDGLIMGQHLYMERYVEGEDASGVIVSSAYICYEDDGSAYVWAENSRSKLEKRSITLGDYNENTDNYQVADGLSETDYIAFPDEQYCHVGAPTSHTPVIYEDEQENGAAEPDTGMDMGMDNDMGIDAGMDAEPGMSADDGMGAEPEMDTDAAEETAPESDAVGEADTAAETEGGVG